jgi:hypothetical protein
MPSAPVPCVVAKHLVPVRKPRFFAGNGTRGVHDAVGTDEDTARRLLVRLDFGAYRRFFPRQDAPPPHPDQLHRSRPKALFRQEMPASMPAPKLRSIL